MEFNITSGEFHANYTVNTTIQQPTVIYVNAEYHYTTGLVTEVRCGEEVLYGGRNKKALEIKQAHNLLIIQVTDSNYNGKSIEVNIKRNQPVQL
jgi:hypothetical protein